MKHFVFAVVLFLMIVVGIVFAEIMMDRNSQRLIALCEELSERSDENDTVGTGKALSALEAEWENVRGFYFLFLNHSDIDFVDSALSQLRAAFSENENGDLMQNIAQLRFCIDELLDTEKLSLENIL